MPRKRQTRTRERNRSPQCLSEAVRVRIGALLSRAERKYRDMQHKALAEITGHAPLTVFEQVRLALEEQFGYRTEDDLVYDFRSLAMSECNEDILLLTVALAANFTDNTYSSSGMYTSISGDNLLISVNAILEELDRPYRVFRDGIRPLGIEKTGEMSQKFKILRSDPQLAADFEACSRDLAGIALLFFDVDHFKLLNSKYTEAVVDKYILIPLQKSISESVAARGLGYSVGGDEFIILLRNASLGEAAAFAERLRVTLSSIEFNVNESVERVTVSIGVACYPSDASSLDELRNAANRAESEAKKSGRNRVVLAAKCGAGPNLSL